MPFQLEQIVPWGRSFEEYRKMFALKEADFRKRILGVGDGPAAFNSIATRHGATIISCDPLYQFSGDEIRTRIGETLEEVVRQAEENLGQFIWDEIRSPAELGHVRKSSMEDFLEDFEGKGGQSRYVTGALPTLPFADNSFDLALCSHFLFLYSDHLDYEFHRLALKEMLRVAREVRVFPLVTLAGLPSPHLAEWLREAAPKLDVSISREKVSYHFQKGGNEMMRIARSGYRGLASVYADLFPVGDPLARALSQWAENCRQGAGAWLDVGCGTGALVKWLLESGVEAYGVDPDNQFIEEARRTSPISPNPFEQGGMTDWGLFEDRTFQVITCLGNVLAHARDQEEIEEFLQRAASHLVPGGTLLLQTVNFDRVLGKQEWTFPTLERESGSGETLQFFRKYIPMGDHLRFETRLRVGLETFENESILLPIRAEVLEKKVQKFFNSVERWGDFQKRPWNLDAPATVILAKR